MSNTCDDGFLQLQALQQQRDEALAKAAAIDAEIHRRETGLDESNPDAKLIDDALTRVVSAMNDQASRDWVAAAMETKTRTHLAGAGLDAEPNNFAQLMRMADIRTAEDYAILSKMLLRTGAEMSPEAYRFVNETAGREFITQQVSQAYKDIAGTDKLSILLASDAAPFANLVERMTRLRVAAWGFRKSLREDIAELRTFRQKSAEPVPAELKQRMFDSYRKALLSERHVDLARSRTGQTLRSLQEDLPDLDALRTELTAGSAFEPDPAMVDSILAMKPGDTDAGSLFAQVAQAVDDTDAARGADKLRQLEITAVMGDLTPDAKVGGDWFNSQMKLGNLLAKDSQLTNLNTQVIANGGSNLVMSLVGPMRQTFENIGTLTPYGTGFSREAWNQGFAASWAGTKQAMDAIRSSGKEVFLDALLHGRAVFAGNKDTFGKTLHANDQVVVQLQGLLDQPYEAGWAANPANWAITRNKIHAAMRLFLFEKTGQGVLLEPALRMLGAVDNVAGLYHHAFKVRNDLEVRVRKDGAQLGLFNQKDIDDWIDTEFNKAFYALEPTEADVKAYRRELGLKGEVSDDDIKSDLINKKIGETYGAPTLATPESLDAEMYSRELRFQNSPGDLRPDSRRGQLAGAMYEGVQKARKNWAVDLMFPYLQSPLMGALLDMNHLGVTPAIDTLSWAFNPAGFTPAQKARVKANWVVAGTIFSSFLALDAMGLIEGNGPVEPQEREEWLAGLKARNTVPNSIGGVPLLGGVPVLNTLFLLKDIKENFITGTYSKYDQNKALMSGMQVLTGQLMRQTSLGQFRQLMEAFENKRNMFGSTVGYIGSGQAPFIGAVREAGRFAALQRNEIFTSGEETALEKQAGVGDEFIQQKLQELREFAYGTIPLTAAIGGVRKETDWLGSRINLPWGMRYVEAMKQRFFPQIWPNDKVYAELDAQNMLNPPPALMNAELDGVGMSDELQKEYNDAYSTARGNSMVARLAVAQKSPKVSVYTHQRVDLPTGATYDSSTKMISIDVAPFLEQHVQGKTAVEAFRSVINSPLYQRMQAIPGTSSDLAVQDMTPAQRRGAPAQVLLQTVKNYYGLLAHDALVRSQSPAAVEWKERRAGVFAERNAQAGNRLKALVEAVNGGVR